MSAEPMLVLAGRFEADDAAGAIRAVGRLLVEQGAATPAHVEAMVEREAVQPTGLPAAMPFALAHSDAPGALRLAVAIGVFAEKVGFGRMDAPSVRLEVPLVAALTVPDRSHQASRLSAVITALADPGMAPLVAAGDLAAVRRHVLSSLRPVAAA